MDNKAKTTLLAYSMFLFIGILFMLPGTLKMEIANNYGKDTADIQFMLTFYTLGSFLAIIINKFLLEKIKMKIILNICYTMCLTGVLIIKFVGNYPAFGLALFLLGLSAGLIVSMSNFFIISLYKEKRTKVLNMLNFCYSFGSLISPIIVIYLLKVNFKWEDIYFIMLVFIISFIIFLNTIDFNKSGITVIEKSTKVKNTNDNWNYMIIFVGLMLFFYVLAEMTVTYWIGEFSVTKGLGDNLSKFNLSLFWIFIAIGRVVAGLVTFKIKDSTLILIFTIITFLGFFSLFITTGVMISVAVCIIGLGCSIIYATLLSYGTSLHKNISTTVMTFYIVSGNFASFASSPITGTIRKLSNVQMIFVFSIVMTVLLGIFLILLEKLRGRKIA